MAPQTPQALGPPRRSRDGPRYPDRLLVGCDHVGEHHGTAVVDETDRQVRGLDEHLAEVEHAAAGEERARVEGDVERPRPPASPTAARPRARGTTTRMSAGGGSPRRGGR